MTQHALHDDVVAAVINYNTAAHTARCVRSLLDAGLAKILVLDNASTALDFRTLESSLVADGDRVRLVRSGENLGFAKGCNRLIEEALQDSRCERVLLVNSDAVVVAEGLHTSLRAMREGSHALMGGRMLKPPSASGAPAVDSLGIALYKSLLASNRMSTGDAYLGPTGGFAVCSRAFLEEVRALHGHVFEPSFFCYAEDTDLCVRARLLGASIGYVDDVVAHHAGQASNAGVYDDFILYHGIRNSLWMMVRTIPASVIVRRLHWILLLHAGIVLRHTLQGRWRTLLRLYRDAFAGLPAARRARRTIQATRRVTPAEFSAHVDRKFYEPAFVRNALRALVRPGPPAAPASIDDPEPDDVPRTRLAILALDGDPVQDEAGGWHARTEDPKFAASPQGGGAIDAGWYAMTARIGLVEGTLTAPQVYVPDADGGYAETRSVKMQPSGAVYSAEVYLPHPARALRFDPSTTPCRFTCEHLELASVPAPPDPTARRKATVLAMIDRDGLGVEIGASVDPIAPKRAGFKVDVIDHVTREELIGRYAQHRFIPIENIEPVDFVWRGESYVELTGRSHHYDWVIASHVVEHTPDLITFLADCDSILKESGLLVLVVPDKRYCFDRFRPPTGLARVIDTHLQGNRIHSAGACAEYFLNAALKEQALCWDAHTAGRYTFAHTAEVARQLSGQVIDSGVYLDIHNWCFVPHSFRLLVEDLHQLGYTSLREVDFRSTEGYEFVIALGRNGQGPGRSRLGMLREIDAELATCARAPN